MRVVADRRIAHRRFSWSTWRQSRRADPSERIVCHCATRTKHGSIPLRARCGKERILDLPNCLLASNRELEILLSDRIPVLVHHHDGQEHAERAEESTVNVVLDRTADLLAKGVHQNETSDEEEQTEGDVSQWPSVIECSQHEQDLRDGVNEHASQWEDELNDPQSRLLGRRHASNALEGSERDKEADTKQQKRRESKEPQRLGCSVFRKLESDKPIDEQTPKDGCFQSDIHGREIEVSCRVGGDDSRVQEDDQHFRERVKVEEEDDLLAPYSGILAANVVDHDSSHDESGDVDEASCRLEDDGFVDLDISRVAHGFEAKTGAAKQRADDHGHLVADEVIGTKGEAHREGAGQRSLSRLAVMSAKRCVEMSASDRFRCGECKRPWWSKGQVPMVELIQTSDIGASQRS